LRAERNQRLMTSISLDSRGFERSTQSDTQCPFYLLQFDTGQTSMFHSIYDVMKTADVGRVRLYFSLALVETTDAWELGVW